MPSTDREETKLLVEAKKNGSRGGLRRRDAPPPGHGGLQALDWEGGPGEGDEGGAGGASAAARAGEAATRKKKKQARSATAKKGEESR